MTDRQRGGQRRRHARITPARLQAGGQEDRKQTENRQTDRQADTHTHTGARAHAGGAGVDEVLGVLLHRPVNNMD